MQAVSVPLKVTWSSMMAAKVFNALRPSRLALFFFAVTMLGVGLALTKSEPVLPWVGSMFGAVIALRLVVMALSAQLDTAASKSLDGTLELSPEGLVLTRADGSVARHPWSWVLEAVERPGVFVLRVDERRGRAIVFLRHESLRAVGALERIRELLAQRGLR